MICLRRRLLDLLSWCYRVAQKYLNILPTCFFIYIKRKVVEKFKTIGPLIWKSKTFQFYTVMYIFLIHFLEAKGHSNSIWFITFKRYLFSIWNKKYSESIHDLKKPLEIVQILMCHPVPFFVISLRKLLLSKNTEYFETLLSSKYWDLKNLIMFYLS